MSYKGKTFEIEIDKEEEKKPSYEGKSFQIKTSSEDKTLRTEPSSYKGKSFQIKPEREKIPSLAQYMRKKGIDYSQYLIGADSPKLYWEQAKEKPKEKDTLLKKIGRTLLPKSLETKFGLREPTQYENWVRKEDARFAYLRSKKMEERFDREVKKDPKVPKSYKEPEGFWGSLTEGIKLGYESTTKQGIGYFVESFGHTVGSPERIQQGIELGDKATIELFKKPELNRPKNLEPFFEGGALDSRWYGRTIGETIPFIGTTIGMSVLGGLIGGPGGAAAGGYGSVYVLEKGNFYKELLDKKTPPDKANTYATTYGSIASAIENAFGIAPAKIGASFVSKPAERIAYNSFKSYLRKEIPKVGTKVLKTALEEGGEEVAQGITDRLITGWAKEETPKIDKQLAEEFMAGAVASVPFGVGTSVRIPNISKGNVPPSTPKTDTAPDTNNIIREGTEKIRQNQNFEYVKQKAAKEGLNSLTPHEINTIRKGKNRIIDPVEGIKDFNKEDSASQMVEELYAGIPLNKLAEIPVTMRGSKVKLFDALGSTIVRYWGLTPDIKNQLIQLEGTADLRQEQLLDLFERLFPIQKEQAELLSRHQEDPKNNPIPRELKDYARKVEELVNLSKDIQRSRPGLQKGFFPQSFINRTNQKINEEKKIIPTLKTDEAKNKHKKTIEELQEYRETLEDLRYIPHSYLQSEAIQQGFLKLLPEGKLTSKFRSNLSKLKGRKIATLQDAKDLGLVPEEDSRVLLASHFEYLLRKTQIYDIMEELKKNPTAMLPDNFNDLTKKELTSIAKTNNVDITKKDSKNKIIGKLKEAGYTEAPTGWDKVAISQLNKYRVNPFLSNVLEDLGTNPQSNIIGKGYDAVNWTAKSLMFFKPTILVFWDIIQGVATGSIKDWQTYAGAALGGAIGGLPGVPIGILAGTFAGKHARQAIRDVNHRTPLYEEAVKRQVYSTPTVGKYSPSIEESMKVITNRTEESYPGWKKKVEKIMGEPVNWKTFTPITLYKANWKLTWGGDRIIRTMTFQHALDLGMDYDKAADFTKAFHADYDIFTKKTKKWANRAFLVPTYKANMLGKLPSYIAKNTFQIAKNIPEGKKATPEQKAAFMALMRIGLMGGLTLAVAGWRDYYLREGYRLIKKLEKPEVTKEGKVLKEKVITLPGPFAEWPKLTSRIGQSGVRGLYMYMARVPQISWSLMRNARWNGEPYYDEGAAEEVQRKQIINNMLKDYFAPYGEYAMMTKEETKAADTLLGWFGTATYKRGGTEERILWEIRTRNSKVQKYLRKPDVSQEDKQKAINDYNDFVKEKTEELENFIEKTK